MGLAVWSQKACEPHVRSQLHELRGRGETHDFVWLLPSAHFVAPLDSHLGLCLAERTLQVKPYD